MFEIIPSIKGSFAVKITAFQTLKQLKAAFQGKEIDLLLKEEQEFPLFFIRGSSAVSILKALSGKLTFNNKEIVCDFYGQCELVYKIKNNSLSAFIKGKDWELPLSEVDFLGAGPPHWFIKGIRMRVITTDIPWKELKRLHTSPESPTDRDEIRQLIEEGYQVIMEGALSDIPTQEPLPILKLKDRSGAFADLWMDYGPAGQVLLQDSSPSDLPRKPDLEKNWEKDLLETDFQRKQVGTSHYYCPLDKVPKALTFLLEIGWTLLDHQNRRILPAGVLALSVLEQGNHLRLQGKIKYAEHEAHLKDIMGAFNRRDRFVQLSENTVGLLPERSLEGLAEETEWIQNDLLIPKQRLSAFAELFEPSPNTLWDESLALLKEQLPRFEGLKEALPSPEFSGILRPYQQAGVNWLQFLYDYGFHGILADDMGLGKTIQVIAFLSRLPKDKHHLIVVPTSLLFNWQREIASFLPTMPVYVYHGPERSLPEKGVIITTYATLRMDRPQLSNVYWECIILDEAQAMKNSETQIAQAIYKLQGKLRLSVTGTPIENHALELWSHFRFLMPELLGSKESFEAEWRAGQSDSRYLRRIQKRLRPFILRRKKEDVLKDLPERIDQIIWVEMDAEQRQVYENLLAGIRKNVITKVKTDGFGKHRMEVLEAILRLRQVCCHPLLVQSEEVAESAKWNALLEDLTIIREEGRKALIYSQFTSMLAIMAKELNRSNIPFCYLDGSTTQREKVVDRFQQDSNVPFFLISLKAGGVGLNLTAADYVFIYDPWWNEAVENQAINRAHRLGRHDTVIAKKYVMLESIEEKIMKLKSAKKAIADNLLEDDFLIEGLSSDDLLFLLE